MFVWHDPGVLIDRDLELELVDRFPGDPARGWVPAYVFRMIHPGEDETLGHIHLRIGNPESLVLYGGHIGYGVAPAHRGHHYAARACRLLFPLARSHGFRVLWITCDPENTASRRTCELAGAEFVEIVGLPEGSDMYRQGSRQKCRYRLDRCCHTDAASPALASPELGGTMARARSAESGEDCGPCYGREEPHDA